MIYKHSAPSSKHQASHGFTFVELIVVVAIMALISTVVLFRQAKFSSDILITDMAYEIALTIRQAEVYGISSKRANLTGSDVQEYKVGYGVLFTPLYANGGVVQNKSAFTTFVDIPTDPVGTFAEDAIFNYHYDPYLDQADNPIVLSQGQRIGAYCGRLATAPPDTGWQCWVAGQPTNHTALTITFVKPNPDAHIIVSQLESGGFIYPNPQTTTYDEARILIQSALGDKCRTINVSASGEISVEAIDGLDPNGGCKPSYLNESTP